jgi:hypothetical protein
MGLAIEVGILSELRDSDSEGFTYFHSCFARLSGWLIKQGLPAHHEPESLELRQQYSCGMVGYSGLHTLRRVAAYLQMESNLPPSAMVRDAAKDEVAMQFYEHFGSEGSRFDHLMMHSDAEGFYLPQDFKSVQFPPDKLKIPGGMVGSSPRLLAECTEFAAAMDLPLDTDPESDELAEMLEEEAPGKSGWKRFPVEAYTCLHLVGACRASIAAGAAIVFT